MDTLFYTHTHTYTHAHTHSCLTEDRMNIHQFPIIPLECAQHQSEGKRTATTLKHTTSGCEVTPQKGKSQRAENSKSVSRTEAGQGRFQSMRLRTCSETVLQQLALSVTNIWTAAAMAETRDTPGMLSVTQLLSGPMFQTQ